MSPIPGYNLLTTSSSTSITIQETLHTYIKKACLGEEIDISCPESTVIDITYGQYGALASGSSEERECYSINNHQFRRHTIGTTNSVTPNPFSPTATVKMPPYLTSDYLDDQGLTNYFNSEDESSRNRIQMNNYHHHNNGKSNSLNRLKKRTQLDNDQRTAATAAFDDDGFNCQGSANVKDVSNLSYFNLHFKFFIFHLNCILMTM